MENIGFTKRGESGEYCAKMSSVLSIFKLLNRNSRSSGKTDAVSSKDSSRMTFNPYCREVTGTSVDIFLKNSITSKPSKYV